MNKVKRFFDYIMHNRSALCIAILKRTSRLIPDKQYLKWMYHLKMGTKLNLNNPQTFSEKLQWLKLYNRRPEYTQMVDKFAAKDYVAGIIGQEYIIPTLGIWDSVDDINYDALPNQFVIKTTHGGGGCGVVICKDKSQLNREKCKQTLENSMRHNIYWSLREWPYKNVKPRIIAEQYIEDNSGKLDDYKFFCFNGEPHFCQVIAGRRDIMTCDFFDKDWTHMPFHEPANYPFATSPIEKPTSYETMCQLAAKLSERHPFLRVDFYSIQGKIYFGELTFFPTSGMGGFDPKEWDQKFGNLIKL